MLENLITLCTAHHRAAHRGELIIGASGAGKERTFRHADGTPYGQRVAAGSIDACAQVFAALRHLDHVRPHRRGGPTTARNGQGLCERCNYVKEAPGWSSWVADHPPDRLHEVHGVTEHLRIVRSTSPPLPGGPARPADTVVHSPFELRLASSFTLAS